MVWVRRQFNWKERTRPYELAHFQSYLTFEFLSSDVIRTAEHIWVALHNLLEC